MEEFKNGREKHMTGGWQRIGADRNVLWMPPTRQENGTRLKMIKEKIKF